MYDDPCTSAAGSGTPDGYYPLLFHNSTVGGANPNIPAQVIIHGAHRKTAGQDISNAGLWLDIVGRESRRAGGFPDPAVRNQYGIDE
jgi:hypothetical protein